MRWYSLHLTLAMLLLAASPLHAQFKDSDSGEGVQYGEEKTTKYQAGVIITAANGPIRNLRATVPVPFDWPEQEVRIVEEEVSPEVKKVGYRDLDGVKQLLVIVPQLAGGQQAKCLITFEVKRRVIEPPADPSKFHIPKRAPREVLKYLGASPYIETRNREIVSLAKETVEGKESAWETVEAIYDTTRDKVEYKEGKLKGAVAALRDGDGDCEELTSLFIALCRSSGIPARTVWVQGHCYPEFYLEDSKNQGHWIPCQAAGTRMFGEMTELRPILQKGDNFNVPEKKDPQRYVAEMLKGTPYPGSGGPRVEWIREMVD